MQGINSQQTHNTLVLGGNGKTGRRVAEQLITLGMPVRIGSRTGEPPFDWGNQTTWAPVLLDVGAVYMTYYRSSGIKSEKMSAVFA